MRRRIGRSRIAMSPPTDVDMARIRSIKPEFWSSEQVMDLSITARLAFIGMWSFADDRGVHPASPKTLKAEVFPSDSLTTQEVDALVAEMILQGLVAEFDAGGKRFWSVTGWARHQKIDRPTYRHPAPPGNDASTRHIDELSPNTLRHLDESSPTETSRDETKVIATLKCCLSPAQATSCPTVGGVM